MSFHVLITLNPRYFKGSVSTKLNKEINLRGDWEVAIIDTNLEDKKAEFFIFCDLVDYTFINEGLAPLMGIIKSSKPTKMYAHINKKRFSNINMEIKYDLIKDLPATVLNEFYLILHFRKL